MKRHCTFLVALALVSSAAWAQGKNPVTSVVREILPRQQKNLVAAAEEMPADKYSYRPTPGQMTFAHLIIHITESNNYLCAKISEVPAPKPEELKETDSKDKLVPALKASFDYCDPIYASMTDAAAAAPVR